MLQTSISIDPFDFRTADEAAHAAYNDHLNRIRAEQLPDDPPRSLARARAYWENFPAFVEQWNWLAVTAAGEVVGSSAVRVQRTRDNQHLASCSVAVEPQWRRNGIARRLLRPVAERARAEERRLSVFRTHSRVPAGEAFMRHIGATPGLSEDMNQLDLADLDRPLLEAWQAHAPDGFVLAFREAPYPEEELPAMAALTNMAMNEAPRDDLEKEDVNFTADEIRAWEAFLLGRGYHLWYIGARDKATGELAGGTEIALDPEEPTIVHQLGTGVYHRYRRRGIGRWLKAAMLQRLLEEWPEGRFVRTANATSNASMLKINHELGFRLYQRSMDWQIETERVLEYLHASSVAAAPAA